MFGIYIIQSCLPTTIYVLNLEKNKKFTLCYPFCTFLSNTSKPNERSCRFFGIFWKVPPYLPDCLQNAITFFLFGLCWVWKSMLDKSIHFVCFPKKNKFVCFPPFLLSFFKKLSPFCQKLRILAGNRQTTKQNF